MFYTEPVLRLPLLLYHLYIVSPPGRRAVGTNRWPWLARYSPLYWGQASVGQGLLAAWQQCEDEVHLDSVIWQGGHPLVVLPVAPWLITFPPPPPHFPPPHPPLWPSLPTSRAPSW